MTFVGQVDNPTAWSGTARHGHNPRSGMTSDVADDGTGNNSDSGLLARNRRRTLLNRVVEAEILPRLALARGGAAVKQAAAEPDLETSPGLVTTDDDTTQLVRLLTGTQETTAWTFIQLLVSRGATPSSIYLGILTQAARRLGELWEEDRCDFAQVTVSLGRLQQIVRALSASFQAAAIGPSPYADTVLLLPAPGEQHTLGLVILSEFFRREGWQVVGGPVSNGAGTADLVRSTWVDVVGFSLGSTRHLDGLAASIRGVRAASRNRYLGVMVGGPLFLQRPDLVRRVGADTTASDAPTATRLARSLLAMRAVAD